jgi:hypothetical protein
MGNGETDEWGASWAWGWAKDKCVHTLPNDGFTDMKIVKDHFIPKYRYSLLFSL